MCDCVLFWPQTTQYLKYTETCKGSNHTTLLLPLYPHPTHPTPTPKKIHNHLPRYTELHTLFIQEYYTNWLFIWTTTYYPKILLPRRWWLYDSSRQFCSNLGVITCHWQRSDRSISRIQKRSISGEYQGMCSSNIEATKQTNALDPWIWTMHAPTRPCRCPCPWPCWPPCLCLSLCPCAAHTPHQKAFATCTAGQGDGESFNFPITSINQQEQGRPSVHLPCWCCCKSSHSPPQPTGVGAMECYYSVTVAPPFVLARDSPFGIWSMVIALDYWIVHACMHADDPSSKQRVS
jgi:hypothetical protein